MLSTIVRSIHFHDEKNQACSGYKGAVGSEIFNFNELHICRAEGSAHPIMEIGGIWISRPCTSYV